AGCLGLKIDRLNRIGLDAVAQTVAISAHVRSAACDGKTYGKRKNEQHNKGEIPLHETSPLALGCANGLSSRKCRFVLIWTRARSLSVKGERAFGKGRGFTTPVRVAGEPCFLRHVLLKPGQGPLKH